MLELVICIAVIRGGSEGFGILGQAHEEDLLKSGGFEFVPVSDEERVVDWRAATLI